MSDKNTKKENYFKNWMDNLVFDWLEYPFPWSPSYADKGKFSWSDSTKEPPKEDYESL